MNQFTNKYFLHKTLGSQKKRKFGSVFLAKDIENGTEVIIKKVDKVNANPIVIVQLKSEGTFTFEELGLPQIIESGETENELFLVKKHQTGEPLIEFWNKLIRKEQLPFLISFLAELFNILDQIHSMEIFHCDLKPSNILVSIKEEKVHVELIDFGLAIDQKIINDRKLIFPLGYAAPELLLNQLHLVNKTSDFFSIGIILYRLFCGELPLKHPNPSIYTNLQLTYPIPENDSLPKGLHEIILKLTVKPKFKKLPNNTSLEELEQILSVAQKARFQTTNEILELVREVKPKKRFGLF